MARRNNETKRPGGVTTTSGASAGTTGDALEKRVVAFAEQLGRIAGTFQARAEGLMDREALSKQIASVRDGAADLLEQLAGGATASKPVPPAATVPAKTQGRSGGLVDAPGKKHRGPMPAGAGASKAASQTAKMRTAMTMVKTSRRRGRG